ncbi:MAG TPA: SCO family protein, partial [Polyangiaceae bacterium]|nr:SCO family protein [Polyangiaceae bacterium]
MSRRKLVLSTLAAAVVAFALAFAIAAQRGAQQHRAALGEPRPSAAPSGALPVLWQVPSFSFVDQNGGATTTADLRGHVWIADFIFTSCTTICPLITAKMALLQRRLKGPALRFVSFSVDPEHDTPEALKRYASEWREGESRWKLLATTPKSLESFAASMFVIVEPGEKDIGHSKLFFLVDAQGGVRGIYESDRDDALERLVRDAEALGGGAPATTSGGHTEGSELSAALGCGACHTRPELAPPLEGLIGRRVKMEGGAALTADAAYIRESIVLPDAKRVEGYPLRMPAYGKELTPPELDALVEHVASLKTTPAKAAVASKPSASPAASVATNSPAVPEADAAADEPAATAVDPVCSMTVRITETTPRITHEGRTAYF